MRGTPIVLVDAVPDRESAEAPPVPGSEIDILARTLWGEARGEPLRGIEAVAAVVMNRVARAKAAGGRYWWGGDVATVCRRPWQFSCWNENDPNSGKCAAITTENRAFRLCVRVARRAVAGVLEDPTGGATHYHVRGLSPPWARGRSPTADIGNHLFYKDVE
ncbi:cell wall hydrolase [Magnetospirillum sp. UT-4]|uniref:cell wall hydrolase n=1 Tax=Magnetospirillum sp. UT-4 TaxID=2681467 RepID=UPI0013825926|nr:cell wall hydrolase [Magnetospirillum sp. UT-4]CAA7617668.1 putative Cell wall hydrolyse [Magnetospirillum sp. UT-4]